MLKVASLLVLMTSTVAFANGGSRGGGDGVVCFNNESYAKKLTKYDSNTGQPIYLPLSSQTNKDAFKHISSIEMTDFYILPQRTKDFLGRNLPHSNLDEGYEWLISRMKGIGWSYTDLEASAATLPLLKATPFDGGLYTVEDSPLVGKIPKNCILSTLFVQKGSGLSATWSKNPELFEHPLHSYVSQVITIVHERVYLMARSKLEPDTSSDLTANFIQRLTDPLTNYIYLADAFNKIKPHYGVPQRDRDLDGRDIPGTAVLTASFINMETIIDPESMKKGVRRKACIDIPMETLQQAQQQYMNVDRPKILSDPNTPLLVQEGYDREVQDYLGLTTPESGKRPCFVDLPIWISRIAAQFAVPFDGGRPSRLLIDEELRGQSQ